MFHVHQSSVIMKPYTLFQTQHKFNSALKALTDAAKHGKARFLLVFKDPSSDNIGYHGTKCFLNTFNESGIKFSSVVDGSEDSLTDRATYTQVEVNQQTHRHDQTQRTQLRRRAAGFIKKSQKTCELMSAKCGFCIT